MVSSSKEVISLMEMEEEDIVFMDRPLMMKTSKEDMLVLGCLVWPIVVETLIVVSSLSL